MSAIIVPTSDLARLAYKYTTMGRLRRDHARGMSEAPREELRALSREFPGALAELDTMESSEIDDRAQALSLAALGGDVAPWMIYVFAYHAGLRESLRARKTHDSLEARSARSGLPIDEPFVACAKVRPKGRVVPSVLEAIARWTGHDLDAITHAVLPRRRKPRVEGNAPPQEPQRSSSGTTAGMSSSSTIPSSSQHIVASPSSERRSPSGTQGETPDAASH